MLDLRDSENSNWIKNVGQQDEEEGIEKSLTLQEWLDKATSKQDLAMEARRKGLIPQSGNWLNPGRWITDPKLYSLEHDYPYHSEDWESEYPRDKNYYGMGTRGLEESPSSRKRLDEGAVSYSKPSRAERRLRGKILGDILAKRGSQIGAEEYDSRSESHGWDTKDKSLTVSEKKEFLDEVTSTLLKFVPSTHLRAVKSISITEYLPAGGFTGKDSNAVAQCGNGNITIRSTKRWKDSKEDGDYSRMGQVVLHEIGHALHQAWSDKFLTRLEEEIELAATDRNIDIDIMYGLEELRDEIDSWTPPYHKLAGVYLGEYHKEFEKEFKRAKRMEAGFTSDYSKKNLVEFFAETYAVYLQSPESLKQRNPATYKLMKLILSSFDNDEPITQDTIRGYIPLEKQLEEAEQYPTISDPAGVGDFEEGLPDLPEEDEDSVAMLNEWMDKQAHDDLRPMNPPSRPPHKGAVWNPNTHRWSKGGEKDLDKQAGVSSAAEAKRRGLVPQSGNWDKPVRWVKPEELDEESDKDKEKKAEELTQPKGQIAQKLKKFNDKVEKILKTLDDLFGGRVDNPQQTFDDLENLKEEVDQEIEDGKGKIEENQGTLDDLHDNDKIDDDTKERADKELELLRNHYEQQEQELNSKWDENYEKLKEKLALEEQESAGDEEEEEEKPPETEDEEETKDNLLDDDDSDYEEGDEDLPDDTDEPESEPTIEDNAKTLAEKTTDEIAELKSTRKENKDRLKWLENQLKKVGDSDKALREKTSQQITNTKKRIDTLNDSLKTQTRKKAITDSILDKKPSLNGNADKDPGTRIDFDAMERAEKKREEDAKKEYPKTMDFRNDPEGAKRYADKHREEMRQELGITDEELDEKLKEIGAKIDFSQWVKPKKDSYPKTRVPQEWLTDDDMDDIQEEIPTLDNTQVNKLQEWLQQNKN